MNTPTNSEVANQPTQPSSAPSAESSGEAAVAAGQEGAQDDNAASSPAVKPTKKDARAAELEASLAVDAVPEAGRDQSDAAEGNPSADSPAEHSVLHSEQEDGEPSANDVTLAELRRADGATIALVAGQAVTELPKDLYIPPEALEVFLETFEGPLDLLLYLIRRQNLDILDVSVAEITTQYMGYIDLMTALQLELVGEYLVMAAMLAEIKSRMLLPRPESIVEDEDDPRAELIRRLQQYERFKTAAENIDAMPRLDRDITIARAERPALVRQKADPDVDLKEMLVALGQILRKAEMFKTHAVHLEPLTVRERMSNVLLKVRDSEEFVSFISLFDPREGRSGVVVTFLAILELVRESMLDIVQNEPFAPIYVRPATGEDNATQEDGAATDLAAELADEGVFEEETTDDYSSKTASAPDIGDAADEQQESFE